MLKAADLELLERGIAQLKLKLSTVQIQQIVAYANLLLKWNKKYSLSAISDPQQIIIHHLLDGLAALPYFPERGTILDVGSGMGVPGVLLAITLPGASLVLLDSNGKKCAFLRQVQIELNLTNLQIVAHRIETYRPESAITCFTSRAFADLNLFLQLTKDLVNTESYYLALKGPQGLVELTELAEENRWQAQAIQLSVPFLDAQRYLIKISKQNQIKNFAKASF